jgi:hypothetical protein
MSRIQSSWSSLLTFLAVAAAEIGGIAREAAMPSLRLRMLILVSAVLAAMAAPARATPSLEYWDAFTWRRGPNPLPSFSEGEFLVIWANVLGSSTPDPVSNLSVKATQGLLTVPLSYAPEFALVPGENVYIASIPLAGADTRTAWNITATDSTGTSAPFFTPGILNPMLLPLVTGITVSDAGTTPTVSWTLPNLTGFSVDNIRLWVIDANSEGILLNNIVVPAATTSVTVPGGLLTLGGSYFYAVGLEDSYPGGTAENVSDTFSGVTRVPEPGALMLMLAALASIGGARSLTRVPARGYTRSGTECG